LATLGGVTVERRSHSPVAYRTPRTAV